MSFTKDTRGYDTVFIFTCDNCGEETIVVSDFLKVAVAEIKIDGWRVVNDEDLKDFYHYCPDCL